MTNWNAPINVIVHPVSGECENLGLTKREYFAAMAMQGLLTRVPNRHNGETDLGVIELKRISEESVMMSDGLIAELNKLII